VDLHLQLMSDHAQILDGHRVSQGGGGRLVVDGRPFVNFAGCNYLALTNRPELREAAHKALDEGCLFSRYLHNAYGGFDEAFEKVEREASRFFGTEAAIYLPSGYLIGFAGLAALAPHFDVVVLDEQAHWCLYHAAKVHGCEIHRFAHRDADALEEVLASLPQGQRPLIATDGAFATSGALPPLDRYSALADHFDGQILVDESHAAGVIGETGRGAAQHFGVADRVNIGSTLSKGLCAQGAVFTGTAQMIERARMTPAIRGSSPGSPISAEVAAAALRLVIEQPELCARARENAQYFREGLRELGIDIIETPAAYVSFGLGEFEDLRALQQSFFEAEMYVLHSNYIAAGPAGMIRMSIFPDHEQGQLDDATSIISRWLAERNLF